MLQVNAQRAQSGHIDEEPDAEKDAGAGHDAASKGSASPVPLSQDKLWEKDQLAGSDDEQDYGEPGLALRRMSSSATSVHLPQLPDDTHVI